MTINIKNDLTLITAVTGLLVLVILLSPDNFLRGILGLPFLLFFPGYTLLAVLFPVRKDIDEIERMALSFSLSIIIVSMLGLGLNYTQFGIQLDSILSTVIVFIITMCPIAWLRRRKLVLNKRFTLSLNLGAKKWQGFAKQDRALIIISAITVLSAIGIMCVLISTHKTDERYTEFYVFRIGNQAIDYPRKVAVGNQVNVMLGIVNHEGTEMNYQVDIIVDGAKTKQLSINKLANKQQWEQEIDFSPYTITNNQKMEFLLYKGEKKIYSQKLHLWIVMTR